MGTRGAYGFRHKGVDKLAYNHMDSYPSHLGAEVVSFIKRTPLVLMKDIEQRLRIVDENNQPSDEEINKYKAFCNTSDCRPDWYNLLRNAQGDFEALENGLDVLVDGSYALRDYSDCEWIYLINLDEQVLEIYWGYGSPPRSRYCFANAKSKSMVGPILQTQIPFETIQNVVHLDTFITRLCDELGETEDS